MQFLAPAVLFEAKSSYFNMPAFVILVFSSLSNGSLFSFLCFELLSSEVLDTKAEAAVVMLMIPMPFEDSRKAN